MYFLNKYISKIHIFLSFHILFARKMLKFESSYVCLKYGIKSLSNGFYRKSPWTQCDFTHLLKEALHTIFLCHSQRLQTEKDKPNSSFSAGRYDANPSTTQYVFRRKCLHDCGLEAALMMRNVTVKYCISGVPLRGDWASFSPVTYCLGWVLRMEK